MSDMGDDTLRTAWSSRSDTVPVIDVAALRAAANRSAARIRQRARRIYASAAIIIPAWLATIVLLPDLRVLGAAGLVVGIVILWTVRAHTAAPPPNEGVNLPCVEFQVALLQRDLDYYRGLPRRLLPPIIGAQIAIVATLLTNPRFVRNPVFTMGLVAFVATVVSVLAVIINGWRRESRTLAREIVSLRGGA